MTKPTVWLLILSHIALVTSAVTLTAQTISPSTPGDSFRHVHTSQLPHNAESCADCHAVPTVGGSSRVTVLRAKHRNVPYGESRILHTRGEDSAQTGGVFIGHRVTLSIVGDGYVEAIPDEELKAIAARQAKETHDRIHGQYTIVALPESEAGKKAVGRFGWKAQHASLLSASADALTNELGVANRYFPASANASAKRSVQQHLNVNTTELDSILDFIRSTEPISPDLERSATESAREGARLFENIGCAICHVRTIKTGSKSSGANGNSLAAPERLRNKEIHPFSDFLLHDVGTGDGIIQNTRPQDYDETTASKFRTAPLWGIRFRSWLMHDGKSITYHQAILRHSAEASDVVGRYEDLTPVQKEQLRQFLDSL